MKGPIILIYLLLVQFHNYNQFYFVQNFKVILFILYMNMFNCYNI